VIDKTSKADISTLQKSGHFYLALTNYVEHRQTIILSTIILSTIILDQIRSNRYGVGLVYKHVKK